ncbi:RNA-guided endonuclease InsQ/TnpB family protein [Nostoc sp. 'Peltigera membranacea cyanobiont' 232]|uniref:RNA-guided endonuclease InsQ/TnpB family protein n=1 Tax=Nostoc sp. 'Peltigera membranacea cyanobiont' 232 TaxID=2014531 RepID=UPI000B950C71|nr:RNA-guided endonuclease TnpB family protein [Nostoc sp. 'Peltigera membranacea cyanobiont' 232]OYE00599.1 transposase [Nostoc sp. 'Peltigera membranacea cyanobiont' 232]
MRITYQYRLRLTQKQIDTFEHWLELCRRQYNYRLAERFNWWEQNRCDVNRCSIVCCSIAPLKDQPNRWSQQKDLANTKALFPEYKELPLHTLQNVIARVDKTYTRWLKGDKNGKKSGRPRFKGKGRYRSLTFPDPIKPEHIQGKFIQLPKIGKVKAILHRPILDDFKIKTATVTRKADGWYIGLSLEDMTVPSLKTDAIPTPDNTVGIDMGLKFFLVTSDGEEVAIPQYYRKSQKRLKRLQRQLSRKQKGSKRRALAVKRVAKLHQKVANQRRDFHYKTALWLLSKGYKFIAYEHLNIIGLARSRRSRLAKSILDAGWGQFLAIASLKAANAGGAGLPQNSHKSTIECSDCGQDVPKTLADRWHNCQCGASYDRDHNAARNIKHRAVGHRVL